MNSYEKVIMKTFESIKQELEIIRGMMPEHLFNEILELKKIERNLELYCKALAFLYVTKEPQA